MTSHLLILNGNETSLSAAFASGATEVTLDLEGSVPKDRKPTVRHQMADFLDRGRQSGCRTTVKFSSLSSRDGLEDIRFLQDSGLAPDGILLAMVESAAEIVIFDRLLSGACNSARFCVIIETPTGLANVEAIAAHPRVDSLIMGGKDLSSFTRMERQWEPLLYARSRVVNAAAMARIEVYDEPYGNANDLVGLKENCMRVRALGFTGKTTIDPEEVAVINAAFRRD
jgi:citrate lyase beta subunit